MPQKLNMEDVVQLQINLLTYHLVNISQFQILSVEDRTMFLRRASILNLRIEKLIDEFDRFFPPPYSHDRATWLKYRALIAIRRHLEEIERAQLERFQQRENISVAASHV